MKNLSALLCGVIFGVGLAISGMTDRQKVLGFLNVFDQWVPDLLFVMVGALSVTALGYWFVLKKQSPFFDEQFYLPKNHFIDKRLILGAVVFGLGWGLYGYCPGPAIASLAYADPYSFVFIVCMFLGMWVADNLQYTQRTKLR